VIKHPNLISLSAAILLCGFVPAGRVAGIPAAASAASASSADPIRYGLVWLDVEPSRAEVSLDGEYLDMGVWLISVAPGEHELRVRKDGFRGYAERIAVPPGGSIHLEVRLLPGAPRDS
jgi:hypothetical protein